MAKVAVPVCFYFLFVWMQVLRKVAWTKQPLFPYQTSFLNLSLFINKGSDFSFHNENNLFVYFVLKIKHDR